MFRHIGGWRRDRLNRVAILLLSVRSNSLITEQVQEGTN
jgi:hypothetical protein